MRASRIFALARTIRCAIVAGDPAKVVRYRVNKNAVETVDQPLASFANVSVTEIIRSEIDHLDDAAMSLPVREAGIDSFDLMSLRTSIEARQLSCGRRSRGVSAIASRASV